MIDKVQTKVHKHFLNFKIARRITTNFVKEGAHIKKMGSAVLQG
jgi:hypothetical protein